MHNFLRYCYFVLFLFCACSTASINDQKADDALINRAQSLMQSSRWTDRVSAINTLSGKINSRAESILVSATEDHYSRVRIEAAISLSYFSTKSSLAVLHNIALNDIDSNVRLTALISLLERHDSDSAPIFIKAFSEKDWLLRETAVSGLCKIKDSSIQEKYKQNAIDMLDDPSENVRSALLYNYSLQDIRIYEFIKKHIFDKSVTYRPAYLKALLHALQNYKMDPQTRLRVSSFITHTNTEIRILALHCINNSDNKE